MNLVELITDALEHPMAAALGATVGGALAAFFNVPILYAIFILVAFDFFTGVYRAKLTKKIRSNRLDRAAHRVATYVMLFIPLHAFSLIHPMMDLFDDLVLGLFMSRELLSLLENYKIISVVKGHESPYVDRVIDYVGMDLPALLEESLPGYGQGKAVLGLGDKLTEGADRLEEMIAQNLPGGNAQDT